MKLVKISFGVGILISSLSFYLFLAYKLNINTSAETFLSSVQSQPQRYTGNPKKSVTFPQLGWQRVLSSNYIFVVYSAHFVKPNEVRVIAATKRLSTERVFCIYSNNLSGEKPTSTDAKLYRGTVKTMGEHHGFKYSGKFIICPFPPGSEVLQPKYVSILASLSDEVPKVSPKQSGKFLGIRYPPESSPRIDFTVCVKPIYDSPFTPSPLQFIEWFEFHKLMGVRHFTFFVLNAGEKLSCVLNYLQRILEGNESVGIEVLPWTNYPFSFGSREIRGEAQGLSEVANECVYRYKGVSKYLVSLDLDKMIVPHAASGASDYYQLIRNLEAQSKSNLRYDQLAGSYNFQNAFFKEINHLKDEDNRMPEGDIAFSRIMLNTVTRTIREHSYRLLPHGHRSKYICLPNTVEQAGTHYVSHFVTPSHREVKVGQNFALLHHYRSNVSWTKKRSTVEDETAKKFGLKIEGNVRAWMEALKATCKF